jgi:hypothetical protein
VDNPISLKTEDNLNCNVLEQAIVTAKRTALLLIWRLEGK